MLVYQRVTPDFLKPPVDVFICFFIYSISGWWFQHVSTPLKNMKVSWDDYSHYMEKCSKPPTSKPCSDVLAHFWCFRREHLRAQLANITRRNCVATKSFWSEHQVFFCLVNNFDCVCSCKVSEVPKLVWGIHWWKRTPITFRFVQQLTYCATSYEILRGVEIN